MSPGRQRSRPRTTADDSASLCRSSRPHSGRQPDYSLVGLLGSRCTPVNFGARFWVEAHNLHGSLVGQARQPRGRLRESPPVLYICIYIHICIHIYIYMENLHSPLIRQARQTRGRSSRPHSGQLSDYSLVDSQGSRCKPDNLPGSFWG